MTSAAFSTTAVGGSGPSAESIAAAVRALFEIDPPPANIKQVNDIPIAGGGIPPTIVDGVITAPGDPWRPA